MRPTSDSCIHETSFAASSPCQDLARWLGGPTWKFFVLAQFSRHIKPGILILDVQEWLCETAGYNARSKRLAILAVNWESAQYLSFDLRKLKSPGVSDAVVKRWATQIGG